MMLNGLIAEWLNEYLNKYKNAPANIRGIFV